MRRLLMILLTVSMLATLTGASANEITYPQEGMNTGDIIYNGEQMWRKTGSLYYECGFTELNFIGEFETFPSTEGLANYTFVIVEGLAFQTVDGEWLEHAFELFEGTPVFKEVE